MRPMRSPARTAKPVQPSTQFAATLLATLLLAGCGDDAQIGPGATTEVAAAQVRQPETAATQTATDGTAAQAATGDNATEAKDNATEAKKDTEEEAAAKRVADFRAMAGRQGQQERPPVPVAVATVTVGAVEDFYRGATNLTAAEEAVVVARTRGVVQALFAEEGDVVQAGQRLAQLETERLELEVARSRTQLANLGAAFERAQRLHESRMISPTEYDDARFAFHTERTNLQLREYELREATIRATIDGVITRRLVKVGFSLNESEPAFEMKRLDTIEAELNVPERETGRIHAGQPAHVAVDALPDAGFDGEVLRVAPEIDPTSGTFRVTVTVDNADGRLRPGMFGRVGIRVDRREDALLTPLDAVVVFRDQSSLFVVREGLAERREVTTGYVSEGNIEILEGANAGELVVMSGQEGLRDGARVRIVEG